MQKFLTYFIVLAGVTLTVNSIAPMMPVQILPEASANNIVEQITEAVELKEASAAQGGPTSFRVGVRDINCGQQGMESVYAGYTNPPGQSSAYVTDLNGKDPDCARIRMEPGNTSVVNGSMYTNDFRIGIKLAESEQACTRDQGTVQWTPWASEGGGASSIAKPASSVVAADCIWIYYQTRNMPNGAVRIQDARVAISVGSGALMYTPWASAGGGLSGWSHSPGDYTTARVALDTKLNYRYNADYTSTTIPQFPPSTLAPNNTLNSNIVMRNIPDVGAPIAMPWLSNQEVSSSTDRGPAHCYEWQPTAAGQSCTQTTVYSSEQFKLRRIDSNTAAVETTAGDLSYRRTVVSSYNSFPIYYENCIEEFPPHGPGEPGGELPMPEISLNKQQSVIDKMLGVSVAKADHSIITCTVDTNTIIGYVAVLQSQDQSADVTTNQTAEFPLSVTGRINGQYQLQFQMVNLETGELFGDPNAPGNSNTIARINVMVGAPWTMNCGVGQTVPVGGSANYIISAGGSPSAPISVTMSSNPSGPVMTNSPLLLNSGNGYTGVANVSAASASAGVYVLTFTGNDGSHSVQCQANLTVTGPASAIDLKFNGSDGPTTTTPTSTDTLSWTPTGDVASCTASMQQGSYSAWSGAIPANGSQQVTGLQANTTYVFRIDCVTSAGVAVGPDTVQVTVGAPSAPAVDLLCANGGSSTYQDGPCSVSLGSATTLRWSSSNITPASCVLTPGNTSVPDSVTSPNSYSTGNLNTSTTFTITCQGLTGSNPATASDSVTINIAGGDEDYLLAYAPHSISVPQGASFEVEFYTDPVNGFDDTVHLSVLNTVPAISPAAFTWFNNDQVPPNYGAGTPTLTNISTTSIAPGLYTITFRADGNLGTPRDPKDRQFVLEVTAAQLPQPPQNASVAPGVCGQIIVSWDAHANHDTSIQYKVYRRVSGTSDWGTAIAVIPYTSQTRYTYEDNNLPNGFYEYRVSASVGDNGAESFTPTLGPVSTPDCGPNLSGSYKKIAGRGPNTPTITRCSSPTSVPLPSGLVYQAGDTVWFEICVRNSGNEPLNSVSVSEIHSNDRNLENVQFVNAAGGCATGSGTGPYTIGTMAADSVCSIFVRATIATPNAPASSLHRFQNFAVITSSELPPRVVNTLPETFVIGSGAPSRTETAP